MLTRQDDDTPECNLCGPPLVPKQPGMHYIPKPTTVYSRDGTALFKACLTCRDSYCVLEWSAKDKAVSIPASFLENYEYLSIVGGLKYYFDTLATFADSATGEFKARAKGFSAWTTLGSIVELKAFLQEEYLESRREYKKTWTVPRASVSTEWRKVALANLARRMSELREREAAIVGAAVE